MASALRVGLSRRHLRVHAHRMAIEQSALHRRRRCIRPMEFCVCVRMGPLVRSGHIQSVRRTWFDVLEQYAVAQPRRSGAATPLFSAGHGHAVVSGPARGLRVDPDLPPSMPWDCSFCSICPRSIISGVSSRPTRSRPFCSLPRRPLISSCYPSLLRPNPMTGCGRQKHLRPGSPAWSGASTRP